MRKYMRLERLLNVRRSLAISLLCLVTTLFIYTIPLPIIFYWIELKKDTSNLEHLIQKYSLVVNAQSNITSTFNNLVKSKYENLFFEQLNYNVAAARVQNQVKHIIEALGGNIKSIQVMPETKEEFLSRINIHLSFMIPHVSVVSSLEQIRQAKPLMFFSDFSIHAPENDVLSAGQPPMLHIDASIFSYIISD